jgi:hypothetical protein
MPLSRMRFGIWSLMVAIAILAVILAGVIELPGVWKRRSEYLSSARHYRWRESQLRQSAAVIMSCPERLGSADGRTLYCQSCSRWWTGLKPEFATNHAEAARSLLQAADTLGFWARRYERAASTPWRPMPPARASESVAIKAMLNGEGPLFRKYFDVL